jgi:hypothetical protein
MTNITSTVEVQTVSKPEVDPDARSKMARDAETILVDPVEAPIYEIEIAANEIDDRITEPYDLDNLLEDVEWLVDELRCLDLTNDLNRCVTRLRNEIEGEE